MSILKDIPELVKAGIITEETALRISDYYSSKKGPTTNKLFTVFGVLGAILVGLGVILIIAHNWDELSRATKVFFAFLPLLIGQGMCAFTLLKKSYSKAWIESSSAFLFFACGACISLISQIYHIQGDLSSFLLTWMVLCLPIIYLMKSSIASLLYLVGITVYTYDSGYWGYPREESYLYWALLIAALPHYYSLYKKSPESNFMTLHNWFIPLSIVICLGTVAYRAEELMFVSYMSLFGLLYLIGNEPFFIKQKARNNGFRFLGSLGTIVLLLALSFDWFWKELNGWYFKVEGILTAPEFAALAILSLLAFVILIKHFKQKKLKPTSLMFMLFILIFIIGNFSSASVVFINLCVLSIGVLTIWDGAKQDHLGILNYGLLIIAALVTCRFFDEELSFVVRGLMFVLVGVGFFVTNYSMLKKRK